MWLVVLFDLPTDTKAARKAYTKFRSSLLDDGFLMMQYSVYMRHCASLENSKVHVKRVRSILPPDGEVRIVKITDKQFGLIEVYTGPRRKPIETPPLQLEFL